MAEPETGDPTRWRQAMRDELIERRRAIAPAERLRWNEAIAVRLETLLRELPVGTIGFYWPFRGEFDAKPLVLRLIAGGWRAALPAVVAPRQPLEFRPWSAGMAMEKGVWNIPTPPAGAVVSPDTLLVPLVGFDAQRYRLGYGGGFFDRTLAGMAPRPLAIGIGYELSQVASIRPQPYDIPMSAVVTEAMLLR
ncbi:MAG: 5-formyltetrahydrofolate cyclo-ligase [Rhodospirillales bacterium]|nr:5-formyltetrahydrofolate cyclo-ligase [Rhodospirillales bacterium]